MLASRRSSVQCRASAHGSTPVAAKPVARRAALGGLLSLIAVATPNAAMAYGGQKQLAAMDAGGVIRGCLRSACASLHANLW